MHYEHIPVLAGETIRLLEIKPDGIYVDGTLGGGGHAELICERLSPKAKFIGIDRDGEAIEESRKRLEAHACEKLFFRTNFANIDEVLETSGITQIDGALLDLGVSSRQLDNPERGFSYMKDAPLDMRMNADGEELTAYKVVNEYSEAELTKILRDYGEERWSARIASFICKERKEGNIESTEELVRIIKAAIPAGARREGPHPAKRSFQAIRIEVNDELSRLNVSLDAFIRRLRPGGRIAVISFHSLEDRIVKDNFRRHEDPCICPKDIGICVCGRTADMKRVTKKPVIPGEKELASNPRARSAKLRIAEKI